MTRESTVPELGTSIRSPVRRMLVKAPDAAAPSLRELAREAKISYHAIRQYRKGQRTPSGHVLMALVVALRSRSTRLAKVAAELEAEAKRRQPQTGRSS